MIVKLNSQDQTLMILKAPWIQAHNFLLNNSKINKLKFFNGLLERIFKRPNRKKFLRNIKLIVNSKYPKLLR